MKIKPCPKDLEKWSYCVPNGDLLFFKEKSLPLAKQLSLPILSSDQAKSQDINGPWTLNNRSWYGYALNVADYCVWAPSGKLEKLDSPIWTMIAEEQRQLQVPTIINSQWLTSYSWSSLSIKEKVQLMQKWIIENEIHSYESIEFNDLSYAVKSEVEKIGFKDKLNRFSDLSGPNCFATTAAAAQRNKHPSVAKTWMHWPEFQKHIMASGYLQTESNNPIVGDILTFFKNNEPIHSAYYLDDGVYFEKTGQDFYEPYRVVQFVNWSSEWQNSELILWRKPN